MMLCSQLESGFRNKKLHNSWLIQSCDVTQALDDLNRFVYKHLFKNIQVDYRNKNPDYYFVSCQTHGDSSSFLLDETKCVSSKNISINQIRQLQEFLNKTSVISGYKVAVIYQADLMNLHAANSCLKLLEDVPKNTYIFLITSRAAGILPSIRSRCFSINIQSSGRNDLNLSYENLIKSISNFDLKIHLDFINELGKRDHAVWLGFVDNILCFMNRVIKKAVQVGGINLTESENKIFNNLFNNDPAYLLQKFSGIKQLIYNTTNYDLDFKTSYILILRAFTNR